MAGYAVEVGGVNGPRVCAIFLESPLQSMLHGFPILELCFERLAGLYAPKQMPAFIAGVVDPVWLKSPPRQTLKGVFQNRGVRGLAIFKGGNIKINEEVREGGELLTPPAAGCSHQIGRKENALEGGGRTFECAVGQEGCALHAVGNMIP